MRASIGHRFFPFPFHAIYLWLRGQSLFSLKQIHFMKEQPPPASEVMLPLSVSLTHSVVTILKHMVILADGQIKLDLLSSI